MLALKTLIASLTVGVALITAGVTQGAVSHAKKPLAAAKSVVVSKKTTKPVSKVTPKVKAKTTKRVVSKTHKTVTRKPAIKTAAGKLHHPQLHGK